VRTLRNWLGGFLNVIGIPGLVQDTEYQSNTARCHVRVRRDQTYTVISVNGVDVYFHRLSGRIDGCGAKFTNK
jgi:hypothetical protein